jgi:hypothetical protein
MAQVDSSCFDGLGIATAGGTHHCLRAIDTRYLPIGSLGCNQFNSSARAKAKLQYLILRLEIQQRNRPGGFWHVLAYHLFTKYPSDNAPWMAVLTSKKGGFDMVYQVHRIAGFPLKFLLDLPGAEPPGEQ